MRVFGLVRCDMHQAITIGRVVKCLSHVRYKQVLMTFDKNLAHLKNINKAKMADKRHPASVRVAS